MRRISRALGAVRERGCKLEAQRRCCALTAARLPVQAHPGLMAASMPWLDGQDFKRLCTWMPYVAVTLVLTRDKGSGRVTIGRDGLPRLHYWPNEHDRESMMQVIATVCWPGDQVTGCLFKQWLAACHAAVSGSQPAILKIAACPYH